MYIDEWQAVWWNNITGPHNAVLHVADALLSNSAVILKVPADLPWRRSMRSAVEEQIRNMSGSSNTIVSYVDIADVDIANDDPGRFLLENYATKDILRGYREKGGASIQEYLIRNGVLKDTIIWIKGLEKGQASKWMKFCQGYKRTSIQDGLFVIEVHEHVNHTGTKNMQIVDLDECVREYDLQLFNSFILDEQKTFSDYWKNYAATLAASLCKKDAEVSEVYLRWMDFQKDDPLIGIQRIAESPDFARRGADINSSHVLSLYRNGDQDELSHRVWEAQLRVLFPIIEMFRVKIINELAADLKECLTQHHVSQFGEQITDPYDLEFGTLTWLMAKQDDNCMRYLYVPDENIRYRIRFLKECRNRLAHTDCCTVEQVCELLSLQ